VRFSRVKTSSAFTLVELMITVSLGAIMLGAAYVCMSAGVESRRAVNAQSEAAQVARVALNLIAADLSAAVPLSRDFEFLGMRRRVNGTDADNLDFAARNFTPRKAREGDFCEVSYFLEADPKTSLLTLYRRRDPTPDPVPLEGGSREEIARNVASLRFEYYDGLDWYDDWGDPSGKQQTSALTPPNAYGMPEAVRITLAVDADVSTPGAEGREEDGARARIAMQTVARVELADHFSRQTSGSNTNSGGAR